MKRPISIVGFAAVLTLFLLNGIGPGGASATLEAATATTMEGPALLRSAPAPFQSEGQQILEQKCVICHDIGGVDEFQASYDETSLRELVATMVSYGAQLSDAETDTLVAYLAGSEEIEFDEEAAGELVATSCTTCHDLSGIERGVYPAEEWRETVERMLGYGLTLNPEQIESILMYLGTAPGAQEEEASAEIDEAGAVAVLNSACTTCHDLASTGVERGLYSADDWSETINRMLGYGLSMSDDDFELIVNYLGSSPADTADAADAEDETFDMAAASALVTASCSTCHDLTGIEPGLYSEDDWSETVSRMLGYGLNISDDDFETIVTYLGSTPDAAGDAGAGPAIDVAAASDLVTSSCSSCHDLTGIEPGLYSEDDWSETVSRMLGYGLNISDEQFETIVTYLGSSPDAAVEEDGFDAGAAEALLNASCTTCHDLTGITSAPGVYSEAEYRETIERMLGYGLSISDSDIDMLVRFLTETYGAQ